MKLTVLHVRERKEHCSLVSVETVDDDHLAEAIGAQYFEVYHRRVGPDRREYTAICDEFGRMKGRQPTAAVPTNGYISFVGDILICKERGGDLASISEDDAAYLMSSVLTCRFKGQDIAVLGVDR